MRRPDQAALEAAAHTARALAEGQDVPRAEVAAAVRATLSELAFFHPGKLVEIRVPPFAAVQIGVPGQTSTHKRGTPPNVVETDAATWLALASGRLGWAHAVGAHKVAASGAHSDLTEQLPLVSRHLANLVATPREPTADELALLGHLLSADGVPDALSEQLDGLLVRRACACRCPTLDLSPSVVGTTTLHGEVGTGTPEALVTLFVRDGRLDRLEMSGLTEDTPAQWPDPAALEPVRCELRSDGSPGR